jgi:enediyne biosynthesis protein E4
MSRTVFRTVSALLVLGVAVAAAVLCCSAPRSSNTVAPAPAVSSSPADAPLMDPGPQAKTQPELPTGVPIRFRDVTAAAGVRFDHFDGHTEMEYIMETLGSGLAWLDYDQDGLLDLFLVQGSTFVPPHLASPPQSRLYRNQGDGTFRDVTAAVGLGHTGCGLGVAVGDIDNDGYPDLFLTCYGKPNVLYHNVPDGKGGRRFEDITARAGLADHPDWSDRPNFSTSAAFLDYDNDGFLDLFVCSYVKIDLVNYPNCKSPRSGRRLSCPPLHFEGTRCLLYHNNRDGTFTDVRQQAGVDDGNAKALGVVALDLDDDGRTDLFVANDGVPNFLFRNRGDGRFEALGPVCGCAVNLAGSPQAYMGVDADDLHGSGRPDLFVTAFAGETSTLFRNEGRCRFLDVTHGSGLGPPSRYRLGFGTCFLDADGDGNLDIVVVNGHVSRHVDDEGDPAITFREPAQLFLQTAPGRFQDLSRQAGAYFQQGHVGRGVAACDYDNDGRMDLAVSNNGGPAVLLHNESKTNYHWIRLALRGTRSNRDAVGARVVLQAGNRRLVRHRKGGGSYLSASDPRLLVGLGTATQVERLTVYWPSGLVQHLGPLEADHGYLVTEGDAKVARMKGG